VKTITPSVQGNAARPVLPTVLSTWDVLTWIAFRDLRPRPDFAEAVDFTLKWGHSSASQTLAALAARASGVPFYIWEPLILDGNPWDGDSYKHVAWSPNGPKMLRWILRQLREKKGKGRFVRFGDAVELLRADLEAHRRHDELIGQARVELLEALRSRKLTAWGKRDLRRGEPHPAAEYETVPVTLFLDELVTLTEWDTIGADPDHPTAIYKYRGPSFRDVRFYAADVVQLWTAPAPDAAQPRAPGVAAHYSFSRLARMGRLSERLAQSPEWVNGDKLADWWTRQGGAVTGEKRRQLYDEACRSIIRGVLAGEFTGYGPHPHLVKHGSVERVLPAGPNVVTGTWFSGDGEIDTLRQHVKVLWLPAIAVKAWLATHNMKPPSWLTDSPPEPAPSGFLYIDHAVDAAQQSLGWSEGRAGAAVIDAFVSGEVATRRRYSKLSRSSHKHFDRENWRGARLDVEAFRRNQQGGVVVLGREDHLHRFLVRATDFDTWLESRAGGQTQEVVQTNSDQGSVPLTRYRTVDAPLIDNLQAWFAEWSAQNPQHSEAETMEAAKAEFRGERITRRMIRHLRGTPDGNPRPRGKKPGKSHAEHDRRMRS
jgi:hypothetical protein